MTTINPGIHNLSDTELQARLSNLAIKLQDARHNVAALASCNRGCKRCALIRADQEARAELRRRQEVQS